MLLEPLYTFPFRSVSFIALALAFLVGLVFPKKKTLSGALVLASVLAMVGPRLQLKSSFLIAWMLLSGASIFLARYYAKSIWGVIAVYFIFIFGWLGILHVIPYYHNWKIFTALYLSPKAYPYTLYFNFDKAFIACIIYLFLLPKFPILRPKKAFLKSLGIGLLAVMFLYPLGIWMGFVEWHPKLHSVAVYWIVTNMIFVCFAEEIFFRGFIFDYFTKHCLFFLTKKERSIWGFVISTVLFSLYHYRMGIGYVAIAFVAGIFYSWAYLITRRCEFSAIPHCIVNAVHFFLFTYPVLK